MKSSIVTCLLLGSCCATTMLAQSTKPLESVLVCKGGDIEKCYEVVDKVEDILPNELEMYLSRTIEVMEVHTEDKEYFLNYMSNKRIHIDDFEYSGITGFGFADKTVVYSLANDYVLTHELGHVYEFSFWYNGEKDNPSTRAEWQRAYNLEFISAYGKTSVEEFYAECFAMYFRSPKTLQRMCPLAYMLLDEDFGDME